MDIDNPCIFFGDPIEAMRGAWIDITDHDDAEALAEAVAAVIPGEEWVIADYESFCGVDPTSLNLEEILQAVAALAEHGPAFGAYAGDVGLDYALETFEDAYQGEHDSEEDFAWSLLEGIGVVAAVEAAGLPQCYIDAKAFARDLFISDYSSEPSQMGGSVYVFARL